MKKDYIILILMTWSVLAFGQHPIKSRYPTGPIFVDEGSWNISSIKLQQYIDNEFPHFGKIQNIYELNQRYIYFYSGNFIYIAECENGYISYSSETGHVNWTSDSIKYREYKTPYLYKQKLFKSNFSIKIIGDLVFLITENKIGKIKVSNGDIEFITENLPEKPSFVDFENNYVNELE